ncbi:hypothetical protein BH10PSE15_BH10PSE15_07800 [soil metagenome]
MTFTVTRKGNGPALFKSAAPAPRKAPLWARLLLLAFGVVFTLVVAHPAFAQAVPVITPPALPGPGDAVDHALKDLGGGSAPLSLSLQILVIMGLLTILPGILLMMTSFTRILIVLSILRQALGLQQTPPNQVLI